MSLNVTLIASYSVGLIWTKQVKKRASWSFYESSHLNYGSKGGYRQHKTPNNHKSTIICHKKIRIFDQNKHTSEFRKRKLIQSIWLEMRILCQISLFYDDFCEFYYNISSIFRVYKMNLLKQNRFPSICIIKMVYPPIENSTQIFSIKILSLYLMYVDLFLCYSRGIETHSFKNDEGNDKNIW